VKSNNAFIFRRRFFIIIIIFVSLFSSLVLLSTKKWRFEREAVQQVLEWFFVFFPFFLTSVQFCFLAFGFFLFLFSIVSYFVPHPPHFTFLACDLRMCIDFALGSDFFRAANPSRIFLVISRCRERERERAQKVSVCRGRAKISAGPSPRVFVHFLR